MRVRTLVVVVTVAGLLAAMPVSVARAGGNWFEIRRDDGVGRGGWETWSGPFLPGTALEVRTSLNVKSERAQDRFRDSAPYYAWIVQQRDGFEGERLPDDAVRLSAFDLRWKSAHIVMVHASFDVPALSSGKYTIEVCDDPCTVLGFGASYQGLTSIVRSAEALHLSRQLERLEAKLWKTRQRVVRANRGVEDLEADLDDSEPVRAALTARVAILSDELSSARGRAQTATTTRATPLVDPWVGVLLAAALSAIAAALLLRRWAGRIVVPDTPEELFEPGERERRTADR